MRGLRALGASCASRASCRDRIGSARSCPDSPAMAPTQKVGTIFSRWRPHGDWTHHVFRAKPPRRWCAAGPNTPRLLFSRDLSGPYARSAGCNPPEAPWVEQGGTLLGLWGTRGYSARPPYRPGLIECGGGGWGGGRSPESRTVGAGDTTDPLPPPPSPLPQGPLRALPLASARCLSCCPRRPSLPPRWGASRPNVLVIESARGCGGSSCAPLRGLFRGATIGGRSRPGFSVLSLRIDLGRCLRRGQGRLACGALSARASVVPPLGQGTSDAAAALALLRWFDVMRVERGRGFATSCGRSPSRPSCFASAAGGPSEDETAALANHQRAGHTLAECLARRGFLVAVRSRPGARGSGVRTGHGHGVSSMELDPMVRLVQGGCYTLLRGQMFSLAAGSISADPSPPSPTLA